MTSLFISYSRKDIETARKLTEVFNGQELDFWIDWEGIPPTVDWWREIEKGIEEADIFLFLLSPDSAGSKVCKKEIEHAARNGKRLIPVVIRDVKADDVPSEFRSLNWIFLRENDDFNTGFDKLITAIKTDYEWAKTHRELQVKALEWERNSRQNGFLLHEKELQDAELQLVTNSSKDPSLTGLQREYVMKSRQIANRRSRIVTTSILSGLVVVTVLAVYGFFQAGLAQTAQATAVANAETAQAASTLAVERANIAIARNAAIQAIDMRNEQLDIALLLGVEANRRLNNYETQGVLFDNLRFAPDILQFQKRQAPLVNENLAMLRELADVEFPVVAISPDGKIGATGSERTIRLWDVASKILIGELSLPIPDPVISLRALAFSPDGTNLASGTDNGELEIWDVAHQEVIAGPVFVEDFVWSISFSSSGDYIAVGQSTDNIIGVYDVTLPTLDSESEQPSAEPIAWLAGGHNDFVNQIVFSLDDRLLASSDAQGMVILWEWKDFRDYGFGNFKKLIGHTDSVIDLAFKDDGKTLISTDTTSTQIHWAVEAQDPLEKTFITTTLPNNPTISPDGKIFAFENLGQVVLLDIDTLRSTNGPNSNGIYLVIDEPTPDSKHIVTIDKFLGFDPANHILTYNPESGTFTLWDSTSRMPISQPLDPQAGITCVSFDKNGSILATGHDDGKITLWNIETQSSIDVLNGHTASIKRLEFTETGNLLVSSGADGKLLLWDLKTKQSLQQLESNGTMDINPEGNILAFGNADGTPILFDLIKRKVIGLPLNGHKDVYKLSFNQDGTILASSGSESNREATDSSYNNIILWDVSSQRQIGQTIRSSIEGGGVTAFMGIGGMFSQIGNTFIANDNLGNITLWDVSTQSWVNRSCQIAGRNFTKEEWVTYFPGENYQITCSQWPEGK